MGRGSLSDTRMNGLADFSGPQPFSRKQRTGGAYLLRPFHRRARLWKDRKKASARSVSLKSASSGSALKVATRELISAAQKSPGQSAQPGLIRRGGKWCNLLWNSRRRRTCLIRGITNSSRYLLLPISYSPHFTVADQGLTMMSLSTRPWLAVVIYFRTRHS
jgi:hypothetical protein